MRRVIMLLLSLLLVGSLAAPAAFPTATEPTPTEPAATESAPAAPPGGDILPGRMLFLSDRAITIVQSGQQHRVALPEGLRAPSVSPAG